MGVYTEVSCTILCELSARRSNNESFGIPPCDATDGLGGTITDGTTRSKPLRHATELVTHDEDHDMTRLMKVEERSSL